MERTSAAIEESRVEFVNVSYQAFPAVHNDLVDDWLEFFFFFSSLFFVLHFFIFTNQVERERERKDVFRRDRRERVEARIYTFVLSSFFLYSIPPPSSFLFSFLCCASDGSSLSTNELGSWLKSKLFWEGERGEEEEDDDDDH